MVVYGIWTFCAAIIAFIISALVGKVLIPYLHKLNFGQTILDIGPSWHKEKQGTPVMGGIMFIVAIYVFGQALGYIDKLNGYNKNNTGLPDDN